MSIVEYNLNLPLLRVNDMVKVSFLFENAYCHRREQFLGKNIESFWTQIINIDTKSNILRVMVSNNCTFTNEPQEKPMYYKQEIRIQPKHIKEHKRYQTDSEKMKRKQQVSNFSLFLLASLSENEKKEMNNMTNEDALLYLDQDKFWKRFNSFKANKKN